MARRLPRVWQAGSTSRERQRISGLDRGQRNSLGSETTATNDGLEQRRGLLSERPWAAVHRDPTGPSEEDPGAAHAVSALLGRDGLIRDVRSGSDGAEVRGRIVEKSAHVTGGLGLVACAQRVGVRVDQLAQRGKILVSRWPHVDLRALREAIAQLGIVESARGIVA